MTTTTKELPLYELDTVKEARKLKHVIKKPSGKFVNNARWDEKKHAEKHLEMLIAMKYCRGK